MALIFSRMLTQYGKMSLLKKTKGLWLAPQPSLSIINPDTYRDGINYQLSSIPANF